MSPTEKLKQIVVSSIRRYSLRSPPPQSPLQPSLPIWKASSRTATSTGAVISFEPAIECVGFDLVMQEPPQHVGLATRRALSAPIRRYPRPSSPGIPLWPALRMTMPRQVELYLHVYLSRRSSVIRLRGIPRLSPMQRSGLVSTPVGRFEAVRDVLSFMVGASLLLHWQAFPAAHSALKRSYISIRDWNSEHMCTDLM